MQTMGRINTSNLLQVVINGKIKMKQMVYGLFCIHGTNKIKVGYIDPHLDVPPIPHKLLVF